MQKTILTAALGSSAVMLSLAAAASAQTAPASDTAAAPAQSGLEEIVVTAQRRQESQSRTPISVAVVGAEKLKDAQINSELDLRQATPGLQVRATLNSNQLNFALRGQSQDGLSGTRPGVLPYINEVQIAGSGGGTAFYDLASVQVLKGPQGTLFGRSATGGAVLYTTVKPTDTLEGYVSGLGGNYNAWKAEGAISGPIVGDTLKARVAGVYMRRDGFQKNIIFGGREGDYERYGARGTIDLDTGAFHNSLTVDYFRSNSESTVGVISGLLPLGPAGTPPFVPAELIYGGVTNPTARATGIAVIQGALAAQGANLPTSVVAAAYDGYFANPNHPAGGIVQYLADQQARGPFKVGTDGANIYKARNWVVTNTSEYEIAPAIKVKNIFGFANVDTVTYFDIDGTPYGAAGQGPRGSTGHDGYGIATRQFSDELQVQGGQTGDAITYVTGVFYSHERTKNLFDSDFFDLLVAPLGLSAQRVINDATVKNRTIAPYAQGTLALNDAGLSVTAGVRYTDEKVTRIRGPRDGGYKPNGDNSADRSFRKVSWSFGIQDQLDSSTLLYAVTRRAYKSGGFNASVAFDGPASAGGDRYEAEQITDVEAGSKFNGRIGGVPVRGSVALWYNWLDNSQRTAFSLIGGGPAAVTVNVPKGRIYGLESEVSVSPAPWITFGGNLNLSRPKFSDGRVTVAGGQLVYDRFPDTPKTSYGAFVDGRFPLTAVTKLLLHADVYGQSVSYTSPRSQNSAGTTVPSYALLNLRAGVDFGRFMVMGNVKNVLDKTYYVGGGSAGEIYQVNTLVVGEPRTFTIEARYSF